MMLRAHTNNKVHMSQGTLFCMRFRSTSTALLIKALICNRFHMRLVKPCGPRHTWSAASWPPFVVKCFPVDRLTRRNAALRQHHTSQQLMAGHACMLFLAMPLATAANSVVTHCWLTALLQRNLFKGATVTCCDTTLYTLWLNNHRATVVVQGEARHSRTGSRQLCGPFWKRVHCTWALRSLRRPAGRLCCTLEGSSSCCWRRSLLH